MIKEAGGGSSLGRRISTRSPRVQILALQVTSCFSFLRSPQFFSLATVVNCQMVFPLLVGIFNQLCLI